ncbi:hypothetical protein POJ06DRAFT_238299 [Lipomyces tetrasporus]|uniref:Uncharacterized protein n=1 Tax=Lipomyces tetrasporus TaxID=54092 RepID=A0AAD7QVV0_9ASCO|nr:uncharacterized protein POJ06DRAFT_238299 [Lipomyces tetrasporus]KAJ8100817.1 hypothetical protein POJ06DRAFT_238299 [Lipomyces tetrasporus]
MPIGWLGSPDASILNDHSDIQGTVIVYEFEEDAEDIDFVVTFLDQYLVPAYRSSTDTKAQWFLAEGSSKLSDVGAELISKLEIDSSEIANELLNDKAFLLGSSLWIIGSDAWSYDFGTSGVHNIIASGKNVNILIIDQAMVSNIVFIAYCL